MQPLVLQLPEQPSPLSLRPVRRGSKGGGERLLLLLVPVPVLPLLLLPLLLLLLLT